jgi:hypothetical protein
MSRLQLYNKYIDLRIKQVLLEKYFRNSLKSLFVKLNTKIISDSLYIDLYLTKSLIKVPNYSIHLDNSKKISNFDKIIISPIFFNNFKNDIKYMIDSFVRYLNNKTESRIQNQVSRFCRKLERTQTPGFIVRLSGKVTGLKHKIVKIKYGIMKYTGKQAQDLVVNLKYQIFRSVGVFGLYIKFIKPTNKLPGRFQLKI